MLGLQTKAVALAELDTQHWSLKADGSVGCACRPAEEGAPPAALGASDRAALCKRFLLFCNTRAEMVLIMSERCFLPHCSRGIYVEQDPVM